MTGSQDRLKPKNVELTRLVTLTNQLLQKRLAVLKTVDVTYGEQVRLPAQYYMPRTRVVSQMNTPKKSRKRNGEERSELMESERRTSEPMRNAEKMDMNGDEGKMRGGIGGEEKTSEAIKNKIVETKQVEIESGRIQTEKRKRKRRQKSSDSSSAKKPKL